MESFKHNPFFTRVLKNIDRSIKKEEYIDWVLEKALPVYEKELFCERALVIKMERGRNFPLSMKMVYPDPALNGNVLYFKQVFKAIPISAIEFLGSSFEDKLPLSWEMGGNEFFHIFTLKDYGYLVLLKKDGRLQDAILECLNEVNDKLAEACRQAVEIPSYTKGKYIKYI